MNRWPSLKQLNYLLALAQEQNFNRAAKLCHVSQSTFSSGIQSLETMLNAQLVERDQRSVVITPLGQQVIERAQPILSQCRDLMEFTHSQTKEMAGSIRLGCIPTIAPFMLTPLVKSAQREYPELELLLREDTTENLLKALEKGELDVLLLALPVDVGSMKSRVLGQDRFKLVMQESEQQAYPYPVPVETLPDHSIFLLEKDHCLTEHAISACHLQQQSKVNEFTATSLHTLIQMVLGHLGVTLVPQMAIDAGLLQNTELVALEVESEKPWRDIGLVWRPSSARAATYSKLAELITPYLEQLD